MLSDRAASPLLPLPSSSSSSILPRCSNPRPWNSQSRFISGLSLCVATNLARKSRKSKKRFRHFRGGCVVVGDDAAAAGLLSFLFFDGNEGACGRRGGGVEDDLFSTACVKVIRSGFICSENNHNSKRGIFMKPPGIGHGEEEVTICTRDDDRWIAGLRRNCMQSSRNRRGGGGEQLRFLQGGGGAGRRRRARKMQAFSGAGQEAVVVTLVVVRVLIGLLGAPLVGSLRNEAKGLAIVTAASMFVEFASKGGTKLRRWQLRRTQAPGILLGSVTLPIVMASRLLQILRMPQHSQAALERARVELWGSLACGCAMLLLLGGLVLWQSDDKDQKQLNNNRDQTDLSVDCRQRGRWGPECCSSVIGIAGPAVILVSELGFTTGTWRIIWCLTHALGCAALFQHLLQAFPGCLSVGEAILVSQGLTLYAGNALIFTLSRITILNGLPEFLMERTGDEIHAIGQALVLGLLLVPVSYKTLLRSLSLKVSDGAVKKGPCMEDVTKVFLFFGTVLLVVFLVAPYWLQLVQRLPHHPVLWVLNFVLEEPEARLGLCVYWMLAICLPILALYQMVVKKQVARIMVRKGFHLMVVIMFVPALFFQPDFLRLALSLAFAAFLVIEMIRVWQIPPFGEAVHRFLKAFTDSRDSDLLIVSHFSLLLGCAVPVWLSTSPFMDRPLAPYAGILSLGIGDTMASVIGYNFGSVRLSSSSNKTVEGTIAGKMAASGSACCKNFFCWQHS